MRGLISNPVGHLDILLDQNINMKNTPKIRDVIDQVQKTMLDLTYLKKNLAKLLSSYKYGVGGFV